MQIVDLYGLVKGFLEDKSSYLKYVKEVENMPIR